MNAKTIARIATALNCVGVVATAALAAKEAPKAQQKPTLKEKVKVYSPAIAVGTMTILGIVGVNSYHLRTEQILASAYISYKEMLEKRKYAENQILGEGTSDELDARMEEADISQQLPEVFTPDVSKGEHLYWEEESHQLFISTEAQVWRAICKLNQRYHRTGRASVNSWLHDLKIKPLPFGDLYGWDMEDSYEQGYTDWIDVRPMQAVREDGTEYYILKLRAWPNSEFA